MAYKKGSKDVKSKKAARKNASKIAHGVMAKAQVFQGKKMKTSGGVTKLGLTKNKWGQIVSSKRSDVSRAALADWVKACLWARNDLNITGFAAVGGATEQG